MNLAQRVMERCNLLATFTEEPGQITRRFATPPMHQVHHTITDWLRPLNLPVEIDPIGNLIAHYPGFHPHARTLLLGSHLDTVRNAGKYDGLLGFVIALTCLELLHERGEQLPYHIDLLGFADEEGLRYQSVYIGSKAITGRFNPADLSLLDQEGISLADAVRAFGGNPDPALLTTPRWQPQQLLGYCELHIEQGPVLEQHNLPLALVSSIVGQQRLVFTLHGEAGHAGTLPMALRRDALCAAAEAVLAIEALGKQTPGLVTTVGQLQVQPGAPNVVPDQVRFTLDLRHEDDTVRADCANQLCQQISALCTKRSLAVDWQLVQNSQTVFCSPRLLQRWQRALAATNYPVFHLPSGAGHDGVMISTLTAISMLFIRCAKGISHHPAESVQAEDVAAALETLYQFLLLTAQEEEV